MAKLYVQAVPPADLNKNSEWFMYPGVWTTYILILFFSWFLVLRVRLHPRHGMNRRQPLPLRDYIPLFHWKKGTPFADAWECTIH